jgi:predicted ATP-grasp superfamily ATP-dependent carboligase
MNKQAVFVNNVSEYRQVVLMLKAKGYKPFEIYARPKNGFYITIEDNFIDAIDPSIIEGYEIISFNEFVKENEPC